MLTTACSNGFSMMTQSKETPKQRGYRWPAEWERHRATWLVWPHNEQTWPGRFQEARHQFAGFVTAVARFEQVELLAVGTARQHAASLLADAANCHFHDIPTNDSWIRDHGPIFLNGPPGSEPLLLDCQYNAWGNKYPPFDLDNRVPREIAQRTGRQRVELPLVLEGGSVEGNGSGVVLTTERCLLNPNRNPTLSQQEVETYLRDYLCADHVVWLAGEIPGDDTDGHIDQLARFLDPNTVLLIDRPGSDVFADNQQRLSRWSRESGIPLQVVRAPTPAPRQADGMWLPASYANFYLVNGAVLLPVFEDPADDDATDLLAQCYPQRQVVCVPCDHLIFGLGALHCLSQQEPELAGEEGIAAAVL
jgi:agmatine deiminase